MIRGIRCSTTILEANLSPENDRGHQITFARSTHNASSKTSPLQHLSRMKGIDLRRRKISRHCGGSRGGFRLADPVMASAVVAHDGGVRLKCAGWVPQDDDSDANGTAVYRRASLTITVRITLWLIGSLQVCSLTAPTSGHLDQPSLSAGWLSAWSPETSTSRRVRGRWRRWRPMGSCRVR